MTTPILEFSINFLMTTTRGLALCLSLVSLAQSPAQASNANVVPVNMARVVLMGSDGRWLQSTDSSSALSSAKAVMFDRKVFMGQESEDAKAWIEKTFSRDGRFICLNSANVCFRLRDWEASSLNDEKILIYGNELNSADLTIAVVNRVNQSFSRKAVIKNLSLPFAVASEGGNKVFFTGGIDNSNGRASAECNELVIDEMQVLTHAPLKLPRKFHTAIEVSQNRVVLVGGEGTAGELIGSIELIDGSSSSEIASIPPRRNPLLVKISPSEILIVGGWRIRNNIFNDERWQRDAYVLKMPVIAVSKVQ